MDGIPMSNDAGMTYNSGTTVGNNISLNRGVDMRTMPTDEIASVEIQQGIPSVEYGDLTSGLIKIKRKEGGRNLEARFKADLGSQLLYVGKGFEWGAPADLLTMNVGANYLDARADPRNTRQNYRRMTGSWRMKKRWETASDYRYTLGGSIDYIRSADDAKQYDADGFEWFSDERGEGIMQADTDTRYYLGKHPDSGLGGYGVIGFSSAEKSYSVLGIRVGDDELDAKTALLDARYKMADGGFNSCRAEKGRVSIELTFEHGKVTNVAAFLSTTNIF